MAVPESLQEIIEDFSLAEGQEKIEMLIQYAETLPEPPANLTKSSGNQDSVPECMTPVQVLADEQEGRLFFYFDIPPQSPTVRGLATILANGLNGSTPEQVLSVPADFYLQMGLEQALTYQRLNGFSAILAHMKQLASHYI
jgi:cysteine desulfuration protein SufE